MGCEGLGRAEGLVGTGDRAVALELEEERLLLVGSDHPRRLEERIRAAMTQM